MRDVLQRLTDALERGREQIICQVVETKGSTPQKAGALMVVDPDGGQAGTLGGGCVEAEVKQKAIRRIGESGAEVHSFILDHDYAWADGLICGGKMVIATEALRGPDPLTYIRAYQRLLESGEGYTEAVVIDAVRAGLPLGCRFLFDHDGTLTAAWPATEIPGAAVKGVRPLSDRPRPSVQAGVAFLPTLPRIRLVVVGGGHVGQGVANLAAQADFEVWVVDDRHQYANSERFPMATRIVVGPIDEVLPALEITSRTYALIVTRGHGHDQEALYHLASTPATYVGLIGSRRKIRLIFASLRDMGFSESALGRVAAPVGLDIGSQTVPEIAISIVAELIARRNLGPGGQATRPTIEPAPDEVPVAGRPLA
ncbi:XdhC family protein [Singulisphaera sp. Ch08]|uniref:XdhC family protein n=1 Tax=Singulisphaera sp. Ch08 TaxID=3120278 RepID=A0AAU7CAY7_9BACT